MFPDVLAELCQQIPQHLTLPTVTDLPATITPPLVQLAEIQGGAHRDRPWNGPALTETYDVDVVVFGAAAVDDAVGVARDRCHQVRDWLERWTHPLVTISEKSRPARIPDYNPNLIRFKTTVTILARRSGS